MARGRGSGHGSGEVWRVIVAADVGTAGRGGSWVGGSGKEWSFGFSVVVGRTCAVAGTSFGANFTGAIDPSMFFVATANAVVRAAGAVPGTFVGATTHTAIQRAPPLHAIALGAIDVVVGLAMAVAGADRSSVGGRARFLVAQSTGPRLAWKINQSNQSNQSIKSITFNHINQHKSVSCGGSTRHCIQTSKKNNTEKRSNCNVQTTMLGSTAPHNWDTYVQPTWNTNPSRSTLRDQHVPGKSGDSPVVESSLTALHLQS